MNNTALKIGNYQDILQQIGGNKFLVMTGSKIKHYGYDNNGYVYLMFQLSRNKSKAQFLKIQLNGKDLYNMEFTRIKKTLNKEYSALGIKIYDEEIENIKTITDLYCDQLQEIFTEVTGMYTRLF
jgi:hypothetical protein